MRTAAIALIGLAPWLGLPTYGAEQDLATFPFEFSGKGTQIVAHPAAEGKKSLAIDVGPISGACRLKAGERRLPAGRYRMTLYARLHRPADDDLSRLLMEFTLSGGGRDSSHARQLVWTQFDAAPDRFTPIELELNFPAPFAPSLGIAWRQVVNAPGERRRPIHELEPPEAPTLKEPVAEPTPLAGVADDLLSELENETRAAALASIDYPALLLDRFTLEPISRSQLVTLVRPQFLHVYCGQANPIEVDVSNLEDEPVKAVVKLEIVGGLDEVLHSEVQEVAIPAGGQSHLGFAWTSGDREFGHEARVTLLRDGNVVHVASEYFSVGSPIWKMALQASGFITWYGREEQLLEHVAENRANYLNVEEAFSWQPSSWTDLTPGTADWWTGQGDFHNSLDGLKLWLDHSHRHGIKMITYLWPSASGPEGLEWARANPELVTRQEVGLSTEFFDVEDLRLQAITKADPRLWEFRSGIWNSAGVLRGLLRAIDAGVSETIASAKRFGWDGARFDAPPGWSAMAAKDVHAEFEHLGVGPLMEELVPEYFGQTSGNWSSEAISVCNVRYARHRFVEHDPNFALSFNFGVPVDVATSEANFFAECCAQGGQIMDEEIRSAAGRLWRDYLQRIAEQTEIARQRGGFHCVVAPDVVDAVGRCYAAICTFAAGSHPYLDFGWSQPLPGTYTQFMTRYGEYCWSPDLAPIAVEAAGFSVEDDQALWWRELVRHRRVVGGEQWIVHLVSAPPAERILPQQPGEMQPWRRNLSLARRTQREPTVWALSAEPTTRAIKLRPRPSGGGYTVEIPEHRQWTLLVWTEPSEE